MRGSPNNKAARRSPETGRRSRDLISGFRKMVKDEKTAPSTRKWAADWLLYLEGYSDICPPASRYAGSRPSLTPSVPAIVQPESLPVENNEPESPEEMKLRELLKETENESNTE